MTFRRTPPPPPKEDPLSVLLMRAIGDLQSMEGGEFVTDVETIAGYLDDEGAGGIGLSEKGHRWYDRDLLRRE